MDDLISHIGNVLADQVRGGRPLPTYRETLQWEIVATWYDGFEVRVQTTAGGSKFFRIKVEQTGI